MTKTQLWHFGNSGISFLEMLLKRDNPKKIFLVTGKLSYKNSGAESCLSEILHDIAFVRFSDFEENPKIEHVEKGIELFLNSECDYMIAVGGGSVIDMAKLINIGQAQKSTFYDLVYNPSNIIQSGKKLIAIPTTSGTGSEATHFAVIYVDGKKYSMAHLDYILPDVAIIIPSFTYSLSPIQTAISGLDAFSQAIEGYWSINSTTEAKRYAAQSIKLILQALPIVVKNSEEKAREEMSLAAFLAGKAINISKTTGPHAMSYALTSIFGIPHGHAVALSLGEWYEFNSNVTIDDCMDPRGVDYVQKTFLKLNNLLGSKTSYDSKVKIKRLVKMLGLETKLSRLNISKKDLELINVNINIERLNNNPRNINNEELREIIIKLF
ncbi:MAG: hypothetical protein A2X18_05500 [Bacteroidetes bacterium GWF2_40_14]|nr:MAG: hypothetical protein A2X18_05500 [Bacteroidetes bacterium GWF2_40_14]